MQAFDHLKQQRNKDREYADCFIFERVYTLTIEKKILITEIK